MGLFVVIFLNKYINKLQIKCSFNLCQKSPDFIGRWGSKIYQPEKRYNNLEVKYVDSINLLFLNNNIIIISHTIFTVPCISIVFNARTRHNVGPTFNLIPLY